MRTGRSLTIVLESASGGVLLPGGFSSGGVCLVWGVCVCVCVCVCLVWGGGVPGPGGSGLVPGGGIPACTEADPPLTESQTPVKTLPGPNFVAAGNKTHDWGISGSYGFKRCNGGFQGRHNERYTNAFHAWIYQQ